MPKQYNPFNIHLQEYLCDRLSGLSPDKFRLLNSFEKLCITGKTKVTNFVRNKSLFTVLSVLTKVGINWGIYIVDESFDIETYAGIVESGDYKKSTSAIGKAMKEQKSFITNSKQFALLQNTMSNACHGTTHIYEKRFIDVQEGVTINVKENFKSYNILHPEVQSKKATEGSRIVVDIMRNLPNLIRICNDYNITLSDFILLNEMYYFSDKYYTKNDIEQKLGQGYPRLTRKLTDIGYLYEFNGQFNITTNGILLVGELLGKYLQYISTK